MVSSGSTKWMNRTYDAPGARAEDGVFVAIGRSDALRQDLDAKAVAARLYAPRQRAAVQQPMPQACIGTRGKRVPELIDTGGFHQRRMFIAIIAWAAANCLHPRTVIATLRPQ